METFSEEFREEPPGRFLKEFQSNGDCSTTAKRWKLEIDYIYHNESSYFKLSNIFVMNTFTITQHHRAAWTWCCHSTILLSTSGQSNPSTTRTTPHTTVFPTHICHLILLLLNWMVFALFASFSEWNWPFNWPRLPALARYRKLGIDWTVAWIVSLGDLLLL